MKASKPIDIVVIIFVGFCLLVTTPAAAAQEENWEFSVAPYLWYASIEGEAATGGDIDVDASDLIDNLDLGFMSALEMRKGKWSILTDLIYMALEADHQSKITMPGPRGISVNVDSNVELEAWIVTPALGYNLIQEENFTLDALVGARYLWMRGQLEVTTLGPRGLHYWKVSDSGDVWDGIVGLKGKMNLTKNWYIPFYLDIGAGETDLTWQAAGGFAYKIKNLDVHVGYRHLGWNFDSNDVFDDLNISGPYAGLKIRF